MTAAGNITYIYDVNGNLASQTVNGQTTQFLYDGARLIAETDANNNITAAYRYFFALQSMERGTTKRYFLFDGQGSTRQLLNESQSVTDTYTYDAFGNVVSASGTSVNPMRYVGNLIYHTDSDSGLALLGLRYYDPTVGRFITADPARAEGNAYLYARANPVNRVDPGGT